MDITSVIKFFLATALWWVLIQSQLQSVYTPPPSSALFLFFVFLPRGHKGIVFLEMYVLQDDCVHDAHVSLSVWKMRIGVA